MVRETLAARQRRESIVELASTIGLTSVDGLSAHFGVTASTIRRDLGRLAAEGRLARTYGGAIAIGAHPEESLRQRSGQSFSAKLAIAKWAATTVADDDSILLDAGSTLALFAHELRGRTGLYVTTASLAVIDELGGSVDVEVECLGGRFRPLSHAFVGPNTEAALERMTFDKAFLGADGVSARYGICEADHSQTRLKTAMAARSSQVYVLADSTKVEARPFHAWARLDTPWTLVTDDGVPDEHVDAFRDAGVHVVVVPTADRDAAVS